MGNGLRPKIEKYAGGGEIGRKRGGPYVNSLTSARIFPSLSHLPPYYSWACSVIASSPSFSPLSLDLVVNEIPLSLSLSAASVREGREGGGGRVELLSHKILSKG